MKVISILLAFTLFASQSQQPAEQPKAEMTADVFDNVGMLMQQGKKTNEENVRLKLDSNSLTVEARKGGALMKELKYADIKSAEYSYSKHPRWKAGLGVAIAVGIFALPLFFMKGKKHWLTVKTDTDYAVLRLDKNNYKVILPSFETKSGKKVETITEDK